MVRLKGNNFQKILVGNDLMKKFSFMVLLIVAMLVVAGCGNNDNTTGEKTNEDTNDNQEEVNADNEETETGSQEDDSERN